MTTRQIIAAIDRALKRDGITRAELARRLGVPRQRVTNMLNGSADRRLTEQQVLAIVVALHPEIDPLRTVLAAAGMVA